MKMYPESPDCCEGNSYATRQLRERRLDLEALESERQLIEMTPSDYQNCRRSLLQAIDELETLLRNQGDGQSQTCRTEQYGDKLPTNRLKRS